jgi:hypothetical protein
MEYSAALRWELARSSSAVSQSRSEMSYMSVLSRVCLVIEGPLMVVESLGFCLLSGDLVRVRPRLAVATRPGRRSGSGRSCHPVCLGRPKVKLQGRPFRHSDEIGA